jgi:hypothetical protein
MHRRTINERRKLAQVLAKWGIVIVQRNGLITALPHDGVSVPSTIPNRVLQLGVHPSHNAGIALQSTINSVSVSTNTPIPALSITSTKYSFTSRTKYHR